MLIRDVFAIAKLLVFHVFQEVIIIATAIFLVRDYYR